MWASKKYTVMLSCLIYWGGMLMRQTFLHEFTFFFFLLVISIPEYHVYLTLSHSQVTFKEVSLFSDNKE